MLRTITILGAIAILLPAPAAAITAKEKMETCKFGANDQKLKGAKRTTFIKNCMAEEKPTAQNKPSAQAKPAATGDSSGPKFPNVKD